MSVGVSVAVGVEASVAVAASVGVAGKLWNWLAQYAGVANNAGVATIPASDTAVTVALRDQGVVQVVSAGQRGVQCGFIRYV